LVHRGVRCPESRLALNWISNVRNSEG
jgi:hypothetical protein